MDIKLKQAALKSLAKTAGEIAEKALQKESAKITAILKNETQYDILEDQLELLDTIAYRVYEETVDAIGNFLERLNSLKLTYEEIPGYSVERRHEYQNNDKLIIKALEVLKHIRYHKPEDILDIFFEYSCYAEESVSKQAMQGIEELAGYELDIFYGNGKDWGGLGWEPQEKVLEKIASFNDEQKQKYFSGIITACEQILSPTISGTSSDYKTITWRTGAIPAKVGVKNVRNNALQELKNLYDLAENVKQKKTVLNAMEAASRTPHMGDYGDDVLAMIVENTITVVKFIKDIAASEDMQIMQKIEHDAYWLFFRKGKLDDTIHKIALEIRDILGVNEEYQKFRILIGFESIFHDWEKGGKDSDDFSREREFREAEALKLAEEINTGSYNEWKDRIISYASIKSNDMATFPYFGKFLEHFGKTSPALALQLLSEASDQLENFIIAMLCGVSETEHKEDVYVTIEKWCDEGKYLFNLARFFEYSPEVNEDLLQKIFDKAVESNDLNALNQITSSVSAKYNDENKHLIRKFLIPALKILTVHKNSGWIFNFWFRSQQADILTSMDVSEHEAILDNLFWLQQVDHHAEEILCVIAKKSPELVIQFFCNRLSKEKDEEDKGRYDAVPFSFHKLSEPLSSHPDKAVKAVLDIYDGNYGMFIYRGAKLLKNIFPDFPLSFQQKLLEITHSQKEKDFLFVMAILRNYDGNPIILDVCKEMVKILPDNLTNELCIIMENTGVISGEYGFVEAYKQKIEETKPWIQDEDAKVKEFAKNYIADLEKRIDYEKKRADEDITLRKHQYGTNEDQDN